MTASPLYRSEVLDAKRNRWLGGLILRQPLSHWVLTWIAICTVSIAVAFLYVGEYARKARVEGRLVEIPTAAGGSPRLEAELAVPETLLAALTVGGEVELRYPAFPHQHYSQYRGRIVGISRHPIPSAVAGPVGAARGPVASTYRATVALERQRVRNDRGVERDLHPGLAVQADVIVERRRLYAWLFEPFSRLRERLREKPRA